VKVSDLFNGYAALVGCLAPVVLVEPICRDPDDDKVLAAAIGGDADLIESGDDDLLALGNDRNIDILSARDVIILIEYARSRSEQSPTPLKPPTPLLCQATAWQPSRRDLALEPPADRHGAFAFVAQVVGKAHAQKGHGHPTAPVLLPNDQHHPAAALAVVDVTLADGGSGMGEALALPVEGMGGDGVNWQGRLHACEVLIVSSLWNQVGLSKPTRNQMPKSVYATKIWKIYFLKFGQPK
jgi:hypothetical protein